MPVEYSLDGTSWTKYPTGEDVYERTIEDFDSSWRKEQIKALIANTFQARIEYSTDSGYSWTPFRLSESADENAARIYTMMQRKYDVRTLKIKQIGQAKANVVTEGTASPTTSTFFKAVNKANNDKPRTVLHHTYVYRAKEGAYSFSDLKQANPYPAELICTVTQKIVYSMDTPNENEIDYSPAGEIRNKAQMRVRGFVFRFLEPDNVPGIAHWWGVLAETNPLLDKNGYVVIKSARVYDAEMDEFFEGIGPIAGVMSGKYILGWRNRLKLGDTWIMAKDSLEILEKRIRAKGGFIEVATTQAELPMPTSDVENIKDVKFEAREVDPNYIMGIRTNFQEIVNLGDDQQIIEALVQVVDFRNRCVDELKALNKAIEEARDRIKKDLNNG